jgi:hypothetical protein
MYYKILNHLPPVPQELIDKTLASLNMDDLRYFLHNIGRPVAVLNKWFPRTTLHPELEKWLKENINDLAIKNELAVTINDNGADKISPHTDRMREYTLVYLIASGGDDHRTVFYKPVDDNIKYERMMNFSYDQVIEVDSISIPIGIWTMLNAQEIHSVENIPGTRIAIQMSFDINPWKNI